MDAIGTLQPVTAPSGTTHGAGGTAPQPPAPPRLHGPDHVPPPAKSEEADFDLATTESKRYQVVREAAEQIANFFVVSDRRFTIFKDASGQYITRFTSLKDGRVTYIPEPDLLSLRQRTQDAPALVNINA